MARLQRPCVGEKEICWATTWPAARMLAAVVAQWATDLDDATGFRAIDRTPVSPERPRGARRGPHRGVSRPGWSSGAAVCLW